MNEYSRTTSKMRREENSGDRRAMEKGRGVGRKWKPKMTHGCGAQGKLYEDIRG